LAPYLAIALILGLGMAGRLVLPLIGGRLTLLVMCAVLLQQGISLFLCYHDDLASVTELSRSGRPVHFRLFYYGKGDGLLDEVQEWIQERTRPTDIIAASMPHWLSLRTGRKAVMV